MTRKEQRFLLEAQERLILALEDPDLSTDSANAITSKLEFVGLLLRRFSVEPEETDELEWGA
jgi:hypothetical protein